MFVMLNDVRGPCMRCVPEPYLVYIYIYIDTFNFSVSNGPRFAFQISDFDDMDARRNVVGLAGFGRDFFEFQL